MLFRLCNVQVDAHSCISCCLVATDCSRSLTCASLVKVGEVQIPELIATQRVFPYHQYITSDLGVGAIIGVFSKVGFDSHMNLSLRSLCFCHMCSFIQ